MIRILPYRFFLLVAFFHAGGLWSYTNKPVLVNLNINRQSDSMGFNMVYELQNICYPLILSGKVKLWDSPKKTVRISAAALQAIEQSSDTRFNKTANVFLHEVWSSSRRKTSFTIIGLSFINDGKKGKVSYGYIDLKESWPVLSATMLECNVNGPANISLTQALYSRNYNFNVVQFGRETFTEKPEKAIVIRDKAFYHQKTIEGLMEMPQTKDIKYHIVPNVDDTDALGNTVFRNIQFFLNDNKDVLFNLGADKYYDYKSLSNDVILTSIEVHEQWTKTTSGIQVEIKEITLYINDKPLNTISLKTLLEWQLMCQFKTLDDVLLEKQFDYTLIKINNTLIPEWDSHKYLKALSVYSWSQVSRYVQFY